MQSKLLIQNHKHKWKNTNREAIMEIKTVEIQEDGSFLVNKNVDASDSGQITFPDDMANRHRVMVQEWIDAGNTPEPYVAPVKTWSENRQVEYAKLNQFEMQFDDQRDSTTTWVDAIDAIKAQYPKPV
jgi:predicted ATP-grasp superfamily ATP-dependent carboligase